jgi:hypothetical protein
MFCLNLHNEMQASNVVRSPAKEDRQMSADAPPAPGTFPATIPAETKASAGSGTTAKSGNYVPNVKVSAGGLAAALVALILSIWHPTPEQSAALTTLLTFAIQYLVPEKQ